MCSVHSRREIFKKTKLPTSREICDSISFNIAFFFFNSTFKSKFPQNSNILWQELNSPYFCLCVGLSKSKNGKCFLSSNISVFLRKTTFSISGPGTNLASSNRAENQPLSFDSRVTFIAYRKVVIQPTFCRALPCSKNHNCRKIGLI